MSKKKERKIFLIDRFSDDGKDRQVYSIMDDLIGKYHNHLAEAKIGIAWKMGWKANADGHTTLGQCKKGSDFDKTMHGYDFVILLNMGMVNDADFTCEQLTALIDHELMHAAVAIDDNTGEVKEYADGKPVYRIRKHDIEEFRDIIERHGMYKVDLEAFAFTVNKRVKQDGLFQDAPVSGSEHFKFKAGNVEIKANFGESPVREISRTKAK